MLEPYDNKPGTSGDPRFTAEQLNQTVAMLDRDGWQVMTHAIGDAAVRMTLDAYEAGGQGQPRARARTPSSHRAHRDHRPGRRPAIRQARRDRLHGAGARHAQPDAWRRVEHEHRRRARRARVALGQHRQGRRTAGLRQRLAGDDTRPADGPARGGELAPRSTACPTAAGCRPSGCPCARPSTPTRAMRPGRRSMNSARACWRATCWPTWSCCRTTSSTAPPTRADRRPGDGHHRRRQGGLPPRAARHDRAPVGTCRRSLGEGGTGRARRSSDF